MPKLLFCENCGDRRSALAQPRLEYAPELDGLELCEECAQDLIDEVREVFDDYRNVTADDFARTTRGEALADAE